MCGNGNADCVTAPLFGNELVLCELLLDSVGINIGLIHFVDSYDDCNACGLCVVDSFDSLGHNTVISGNNEHGNIRSLCAACTH